ncbi:MAG: Lon protease [Pseudomonadota bacterium]|jgi:predicted ATP-dependent protease
MSCSRVEPAALRRRVDAAALGFASTRELVGQPLPWIGQARAEAAARFGLGMALPGYNLWVVGEVGSGRTTLMRQLMRQQARSLPVPPDLCYLHHVEAPEQPLALRLPPGQGRQLRQRMQQLMRWLPTEIPRRLAEADVKAESQRIAQVYQSEEARAYAELHELAQTLHFSLLREQGHLVFTARDAQGEPLTAGKAMAMSAAQRSQIDQGEATLREAIARFLEKTRGLERVMNEGLAALQRQVLKPMLEREMREIRQAVQPTPEQGLRMDAWLQGLQASLLEHVALFAPGEDEEGLREDALQALLEGLRVNVAVDNHGLQGAPVIQEDNPSHRQLFGSIEYASDGEMLVTDFMRIRAGSLLRAHGGFLMLHLRDALADAPVWDKLRRFLRSGRLQIEEPGTMYAPIAAVSLSPEAVPVEVKLVLVASPEDFDAVQALDPEFARRFRCKVDFADSLAASEATWRETAVFVARLCARWGLPHVQAPAVALLIEDSHRHAQDQFRQSAIFAHTEALAMESAAIARARGAETVAADDVRAAWLARRWRHNEPEERLLDALAQGERVLPVTGHLAGGLNGLSVVQLGDHSFGFPVRVSARTSAGDKGVLSIDREVELSGPVHDKGVLVLHSYLSVLFEHLAPLALDASLVFEQEYGGIEGDSASCAELYALLSSLAGVPMAQGIAVTGAFNTQGDMLPVGGINEKIEGFFRSCERLGLDGSQGVLMPTRNLRHLMLDEAVVQAVAQGRFHIHAASTVAQGMALLTGLPWGERGPHGYPEGSVLGRAQTRLRRYRHALDRLNLAAEPALHKRHPLHSA